MENLKNFDDFVNEEINLGASWLSKRKLNYDLVLSPEKREKIIKYLLAIPGKDGYAPPFNNCEEFLRKQRDWQLKDWWDDYKPINPKRDLYHFVSSIESELEPLPDDWEKYGGSTRTHYKLRYDDKLSTKLKKRLGMKIKR
jgi:hypothetical protein